MNTDYEKGYKQFAKMVGEDNMEALVSRFRSVCPDFEEEVYQLIKNMNYELGLMAHSCGASNARELRRHHAQLINEVGIPEPIEKSFPSAQVNPEHVISSDALVESP